MPGLFDYEQARLIEAERYSFYALVQAAMRQADTENQMKLQAAFPEEWAELQSRYNAPGGRIGRETEVDADLSDAQRQFWKEPD